MASKFFIKIWSILLSSLALSTSESAAILHNVQDEQCNEQTQLSIRQSNKADLFLQQAKNLYADTMQFAAHRSHSSHRSHYSSRTYTHPSPPETAPTTTTPGPSPDQQTSDPSQRYSPRKPALQAPNLAPNTSPQSYLLNRTDIKMIQVSLNLLGFNAGKVDGNSGDVIKDAIKNFQQSIKVDASGQFNSQTCIDLARKIKDKFPDDPKANEIHNHLLRLYLNMSMQ